MNDDTPPARRTTRFDAMQAWNSAIAAIKTNRDTLLVIAGLFFLLPQLVLAFVLPEAPTDVGEDEVMKQMAELYADNWYLFIGWFVLQAIGTLCVIILLTDRARPTVGEAMGSAMRLMPINFAAQLIVMAGIGIMLLIVLLVASLTGSEGIMVLAVVVALPVAAWIFIRTSLSTPVIGAERERNPFEALKRSWAMTAGAAGRLALFFVLIFIAVMVINVVVTAVPGAILGAVAGQETAMIYGAVAGSLVAAAFALLSAALLTAIYGQLGAR